MARYKDVDNGMKLLAVDLGRQLLPGTFEHALAHLIDHELDLSHFDAHYRNDGRGSAAYPPAVLLKVVLFAYLQGLVSSRAIDGVKLPSNAAKARSGTRADFQKQLGKLEAAASVMLQRHRDQDNKPVEADLQTKHAQRLGGLQR